MYRGMTRRHRYLNEMKALSPRYRIEQINPQKPIPEEKPETL